MVDAVDAADIVGWGEAAVLASWRELGTDNPLRRLLR